jgi:hypothetical protein
LNTVLTAEIISGEMHEHGYQWFYIKKKMNKNIKERKKTPQSRLASTFWVKIGWIGKS